MKDLSTDNFGILIAYLLPGFIAIWGVSVHSPMIRDWLITTENSSPAISEFLFGTLASLSAGLIVNAVRWHLVDPIHYLTGVPRKVWDYSRLPEQINAFRYLVGNQFRYYECYANSFVAIAFTSITLAAVGEQIPGSTLCSILAIEIVLWSASRRTLSNYHKRIAAFLAEEADVEESQKQIDQKPACDYTPGWAPRRRPRISLLFPMTESQRLKRHTN